MHKTSFILKAKRILFFNILFILGFWNSCQCHQPAQTNSSSSSVPSENSNSIEQQSLPISQLSFRKFLSIFVGEFLEILNSDQYQSPFFIKTENPHEPHFFIDPKTRLIQLNQHHKDKEAQKRRITKLNQLLENQNEMDQNFGKIILEYIENQSSGKKKLNLFMQELNQRKTEHFNIDKINQLFTICSQYDLKDVINHPELEKQSLTKNGKLPFSAILNLIFLTWKQFKSNPDLDSKLLQIKLFSQVKALELLSLASIWLEDFLNDDKKNDKKLSEKMKVADFCTILKEEELQKVISSWIEKLIKKLKTQNKVTSNRLILAIELSRAQFSKKAIPASLQWLHEIKTLEFIDQYFSENKTVDQSEFEKQIYIALGLRQVLKQPQTSQKINHWLEKKESEITSFVQNQTKKGELYCKDGITHLILYYLQHGNQKLAQKFFADSFVILEKLESVNPIEKTHHLVSITQLCITHFGPAYQIQKVKEAWDFFQEQEEKQEENTYFTHQLAYMMSGKDDLTEKAKGMLEGKPLEDLMNLLLWIHSLNTIKENTFTEQLKAYLEVEKEKILKFVENSLKNENLTYQDKLLFLLSILELGWWKVGQEQEWIKNFFISENLLKKIQKFSIKKPLSEGYVWLLCCSSFFASL